VPLGAFSLLVHTEQPIPTRLFLKKSRTSLRLPVQSRSENALICAPLLVVETVGQIQSDEAELGRAVVAALKDDKMLVVGGTGLQLQVIG